MYKLAKALADNGAAQAAPYGMGETLLATVIAFVVGYAVIAWLMKFISSNSYMPFVWYRIVLGLALYVMLGTGMITA